MTTKITALVAIAIAAGAALASPSHAQSVRPIDAVASDVSLPHPAAPVTDAQTSEEFAQLIQSGEPGATGNSAEPLPPSWQQPIELGIRPDDEPDDEAGGLIVGDHLIGDQLALEAGCRCDPYDPDRCQYVGACDCKGHYRHYGYPWPISQDALSAAPYGNPCAFEKFDRPFGSFMRRYLSRQVQRGVAARMVLFHYDFHRVDSDRRVMLNEHGHQRLVKLAHLMTCSSYPLIIESTDDPALDRQRRDLVASMLQSSNLVPDAFDRVRVATAPGRGLEGIEAVDIYRNMLIHTRAGGSIPLRGIELDHIR
jgi:hypothetical protein